MNTQTRNKNDCGKKDDDDPERNGLVSMMVLFLPSNAWLLLLVKLLFVVFLLMEVNFLIEDDLLSLEVVLLIPLLSLSLCALILLLLQLFLDRQCRNEEEREDGDEEGGAGDAFDDGNWGDKDEDNGKIE